MYRRVGYDDFSTSPLGWFPKTGHPTAPLHVERGGGEFENQRVGGVSEGPKDTLGDSFGEVVTCEK
jgi:hypothetical protein